MPSIQAMVGLGYTCAAMDIEFVRLEGEKEAYELVEINSRYSYMGVRHSHICI